MITLISKWKLRNGCPEELIAALKQLVENIYPQTETEFFDRKFAFVRPSDKLL
jgi:hypothetical protein